MTGDYRLEREDDPLDFAGLFGNRKALVVYSYMFDPQRERCARCASGPDKAPDSGVLCLVAGNPCAKCFDTSRHRLNEVSHHRSRDFGNAGSLYKVR